MNTITSKTLIVGGTLLSLVYLLHSQQVETAQSSSAELPVGVLERLKELEDFKKQAESRIVPAGTISPYGGSYVPKGWILCDGSALNGAQAEYKALFEAIGVNWGDGKASAKNAAHQKSETTSFNLPDLRGYFLRGLDGSGEGRDPDLSSRNAPLSGGSTKGNVGSYQMHAFQSHVHTLPFIEVGRASGHGEPVPFPSGRHVPGAEIPSKEPSGNIATETRPRNAYVHYIIKL